MTLHEYPELEQGSEEWHTARRGIVTASTVGRLISSRYPTAVEYDCPDCGATTGNPCLGRPKKGEDERPAIKTFHSHRTTAAAKGRETVAPILEPSSSDDARALTYQLVAERITGYTDPTFMSDDMLRGHMDEVRARDLYSEKYAPATETGFLVLEKDGYKLGYSPDGLVGSDGLIEVKSPRAKTHIRTVLSGKVPAHHMAQIQCGLLVTGRDWCDFLSYSGGLPMWPTRVLPDPAWHDAIRAAVVHFENEAARMIADFAEATQGLAQTERVDYTLGLVF